MTIKVLIADDQNMVRTGFRLILDSQSDIEVVGEAADGAACVEMARRLRPDVCLVDISMPRLNGLEVTRLLAGPEVIDPLRVVVVTTFDLDEYVYGSLRGGAQGFLLKDSGPTLLIEAVRAVAAGDAMVCPSITVRLLKRFSAGSPEVSAPRPVAPSVLTERETAVARLVARGLTNQEISRSLAVSLSTTKSHLANIQTKLGVRNRVEIAAWAWESRTAHPGGATEYER
ncbi:response regulator [Streptomyces sp. NPDC004111]|uniref:response regulator n=1 Tax=Streptomyces sp. NPDC004111 TaxID=3364690 RepID=UPI0036837097